MVSRALAKLDMRMAGGSFFLIVAVCLKKIRPEAAQQT